MLMCYLSIIINDFGKGKDNRAQRNSKKMTYSFLHFGAVNMVSSLRNRLTALSLMGSDFSVVNKQLESGHRSKYLV